jgi:hypothetical protein
MGRAASLGMILGMAMLAPSLAGAQFIRPLMPAGPEVVWIEDEPHSPLTPIIHLVAVRADTGRWHVSRTCQESPTCSVANFRRRTSEYDLSESDSAKADQILDQLIAGADKDTPVDAATVICGHLNARIRHREDAVDYTQTCATGETLGKLEKLLADGGP